MAPNEAQGSQEQSLERPLVLFDGDCGFCRYWVARWQARTRGLVDFAPAQAEAGRFPQITEEAWKRSVQLVTPTGEVYSGAEAVFRTLAYTGEHQWLLKAYQKVPGGRLVSEAGYRAVAEHRGFFSKLTYLAWGRDPEPSSYALTRWVFLRLLGLVYVIAFLSLRGQIAGLLVAQGILPVGDYLQAVHNNLGAQAYHLIPTLAWIGSSDAALKFFCSAGALCGLLVMLGVMTGPALVLTWVGYLSLVSVGQDFLAFQWDILLLETGFLAIFFAPWQWVEAPWRAGTASVSRIMIWLDKWLLFRLMFLSGAVKLLSGDATWRNLTALQYHYWTQPLPTPVAWYVAQLPDWFQKFSVLIVFAGELVVPFLIFTPRRIRRVGAVLIVIFQLLIALTGNYCFFNLLAIILCVLLLDDAWLRRWLPKWLANRCEEERGPQQTVITQMGKWIRVAVAVVLMTVSCVELLKTFGLEEVIPGFVEQMVHWQGPFDLANSYGLFAVMTTSRIEIVVEGSNDAQTWQAYEFKYKPGDLARHPPWVAPYQPRLDWQMWFAALGNYRENPWFANFMIRLLQGSPQVTALLEKNPFASSANGPPRYIRAVAYEYHFTDSAERRATGDWWKRERRGLYFPEVSLRGQ